MNEIVTVSESRTVTAHGIFNNNIIKELLKKGGSVIMISSDLVEILKMSDRIMVMHEGEIATILENTNELTQKDVLEYALHGGGHDERQKDGDA